MFLNEIKKYVHELNESDKKFDFDYLNNIIGNLNVILKFNELCLYGDDVYLIINKSDLKIYYEDLLKERKIPNIKNSKLKEIQLFVSELDYLSSELANKLKAYYTNNY